MATYYNTITDPNSEFKYGLLYGNFDQNTKTSSEEINSGTLIAQKIFQFAYDNCIPISLGQTNPYGSCGACVSYYKNVSKMYLSRRLKSPYLYLLLGHSNIKNGNKQYIDKATGHDFQSALGHTYYYRNNEKGYIINVSVNLDDATFHYGYKSAQDFAGINKKSGTGLKQLFKPKTITSVVKTQTYDVTIVNLSNTFEFTDDWFLACAEYIMQEAVKQKDGSYKIDNCQYRFVDFLFKDYKREYKYENDYIKKYIDSKYNTTRKDEYTPPSHYDIDPDIKIGERNIDFEKARDCAAANNIPLFAVWTRTSCHFCDIFDGVLNDSKFTQWMRDTGIIMVYLKANKDSDYLAARDWIRGSYTGFPFACVYWATPEGEIKMDRFMGRASSYGAAGKGGADNLISRIKKTIGDWKYMPQPQPGPPAVKGDGNMDNAILGAESGFITGQWYKYTGSTNSFRQLIAYANSSGLPMIFVASAAGCVNCNNFKARIQSSQEMIDWYANSGCLLVYLFAGAGWWTGGDLKVFVTDIQGGRGTGMPTIGVWKQGNILWQQTSYSTSQTVQTMQNLFEDAIGRKQDEAFQPGVWTIKYREAKAYAEQNNLPYIGVVSKNDAGCHFCAIFRPKITDDKILQWAKRRNVILGMFKTQAPDLTDKAWVDWAAGDNTGYPFVRFYWKKKDGTVVSDIFMGRNTSIGDCDKDGSSGTVDDLIARFEKDYNEGMQPDVYNDIKLISFQPNSAKTTTAKDAGAESVGLDQGIVLAQDRTEYTEMQTDLWMNCSNFYGWNSHYNDGSFAKDIVNKPNGRGDALDLALGAMEKNHRPLFLIYTRAYNKGSNVFNQAFYKWKRAFPQSLANFSKCQAQDFDQSKPEYGFYFLHYQNDADETNANANKAKAFITQFGQITTGYPWYMAYCKSPGGRVYARYGSLYSVSKNASDTWQTDEDIYTRWGDVVKEFGKEIQYAYTGLESSINSEQ